MLGIPTARQVGCDDGVAGVETDLETEQHRAFGVRLHRAAELAVGVTKQGSLAVGVEAQRFAKPGRGSEDSSRRRAEEA